MSDPRWIAEARRLIGLKEIAGSEHNTEIVQFWRDIRRSGIKDDETPWCAAFVGACLERAGIQSSRFEAAQSYLKWGVRLDGACYGAIAVLTRTGGGHVGFVVGQTEAGRILLLGGNQDNQVSIAAFDRYRFTGYRYPVGEAIDNRPLPIGMAAASASEA